MQVLATLVVSLVQDATQGLMISQDSLLGRQRSFSDVVARARAAVSKPPPEPIMASKEQPQGNPLKDDFPFFCEVTPP